MLYHPGKTALCASMLLLCRILGAQQLTGSISGTVADKSGSPIAGAAVQLVSETTGASREGGTDAEGSFQFPAIAAGMDRRSVKHPGCKDYERRESELTPHHRLA